MPGKPGICATVFPSHQRQKKAFSAAVPLSSFCLAPCWGAPDEWIEMGHWVLGIVAVLVIAGVVFAGWDLVRGVVREVAHTERDPLHALRHAKPRRNTPAQDAG